jgi:hypothetical protein
MNEKTGGADHRSGQKYVRFIDWLNHKLVPVIGPPDLSPYGDVLDKISGAACPVCGHPMSEHTIDHSSPNTVLNCPVAHTPQPFDDKPINEFGMPSRKVSATTVSATNATRENRHPRTHV